MSIGSILNTLQKEASLIRLSSELRLCRAGKSTLIKLLMGEIQPLSGQLNQNGRLRRAYFAQHHLDQLDLNLSPVAFLALRLPGKTEQEYRQHLGAFGITGMTGLQTLNTLSGGQKSRVTFALLSLSVGFVIVLSSFVLSHGKGENRKRG